MKNKKHLFVLLVLIPLLFSSCGNKFVDEKIDLSNGWEYSLTDTNDYQALSDGATADVKYYIPNTVGTIYIRHKFEIPEGLKDYELACFLGRITMADETFINGSLIGSTGRFGPENEWSCWNVARYYKIPSGLLKENGTNEIKIKIWCDGEGGIVSSPFIGESATAYNAFVKEDFWNAKIHFLCAFVMFVLCVYHFILWLNRPKDKENLVFSIMNIITPLYLSVFYIEQVPGLPTPHMNFLIFQKIFSSSMPFIIVFVLTSFINSFLGRKEKIWVRLIRIAFIVGPLIYIFTVPVYPILTSTKMYVQIALLPSMIYVIYVIIESVVKGKKDVWTILAGCIPCVLVGLIDMFIHFVLKMYSFPYISGLAWMIVILAFLFILAGRFSDARNQAEDLNLHLESKVTERTRELSEANELLAASNIAAERDMRLAVFVQQSFFPRKKPDVDDYDVAFFFKPMAGVSGDLFDFYTNKNKLDGVALFDVSGHGISSGLVTMLAKTIIGNEFEKGKDKRLADVMYSLNQQICNDKGDVENYLTGILLRFGDNYIDYVNAGHPSLLYRNKKGKVNIAAVQGMDATGSLVGMRDLPVEYKTMRFGMNSGDTLLIYTDCLQESRNLNGDEFSALRVQKALSLANGETAQDKLDSILNNFNNFTNGVPLNDDLTVIVIQKK